MGGLSHSRGKKTNGLVKHKQMPDPTMHKHALTRQGIQWTGNHELFDGVGRLIRIPSLCRHLGEHDCTSSEGKVSRSSSSVNISGQRIVRHHG